MVVSSFFTILVIPISGLDNQVVVGLSAGSRWLPYGDSEQPVTLAFITYKNPII